MNRGGDMRMHGMLGVPMPMRDQGYNHLPFVKEWPFANDVRWVDNYGRFHATHSRFGGEYYGYVPVFHFTENGTVAIEGGFACFGFPHCRNCMVFCQQTPHTMVLRNFGWEWRRGIQKTVKYAPDNQHPANVWCRNFLFEMDSFQCCNQR